MYSQFLPYEVSLIICVALNNLICTHFKNLFLPFSVTYVHVNLVFQIYYDCNL